MVRVLVEFAETESADGPCHRQSKLVHVPRALVLRRLAEPRYFKCDHAEFFAQKLVCAREPETAGTVEMYERRPLSRFHIPDAETVGLDETFGELGTGRGSANCYQFRSL